eukprot:1158975-Pelagomonas_calceolata.AAC.2
MEADPDLKVTFFLRRGPLLKKSGVEYGSSTHGGEGGVEVAVNVMNSKMSTLTKLAAQHIGFQ